MAALTEPGSVRAAPIAAGVAVAPARAAAYASMNPSVPGAPGSGTRRRLRRGRGVPSQHDFDEAVLADFDALDQHTRRLRGPDRGLQVALPESERAAGHGTSLFLPLAAPGVPSLARRR